MMKYMLAFVALATLLPAQTKQDEGKAIREFKKAFRSTKKRPRTLTERMNAIKLLIGYDSAKTAQQLAHAFQTIEDEIVAEDAERLRLAEEISGLEAKKNPDGSLETTLLAQLRGCEDKWRMQRVKLDNLRQVQAEVGKLIRDLKEYASLSWLVKNVLTNKRFSLLLKVTVCSSAGGLNRALLADMQRALQKAKLPHDLMALLDGIGHIGKDAESLAPRILKLLGHKNRGVVARAALCLAWVQHVPAVVPLIDKLEKTEGETRKLVSVALQDLTGQRHGTSVTSWRGWYEKEGKALIASGKLVPDGRGSELFDTFIPTAKDEARYYMGIPQDGEAILYVIDSSGSMKKPVKWGKPGHEKGGMTVARSKDEKAAGRWANTRLGACKMELIDALAKLPRTKIFNILWYSDYPHKWRDTMTKALPMNIKEAQDWVRKLQPKGMTNIHDSLQVAFTFARGRGIRDRAYSKGKIGLDTIFLLTDGTPTTPSGAIDDHEKILRAVRQWNPLKRVVIHTIGIGEGLNLNFMERLAAENRGDFKHYTDTGTRRN